MFGINALRSEVRQLRAAVSGQQLQVRMLRDQIALIAAERDDAEKLALRKLIRDLIGGKPNVDKFLDVLGDYAHLFEDGPLQGDVNKLMDEAGKVLPGDRGEST